MRSDHLLRAMHKVFSHDLPNQMVVLQSLLQFLEAEESANLTEGGKEYVHRMQDAARRAREMVRFLKEMGRLNNFRVKADKISLPTLTRELEGELRRLRPEIDFEFAWQWDVARITGDERLITRALLEAFSGLLNPHTQSSRASGRSEHRGEFIELAFELFLSPVRSLPASGPEALEQRMEIVLARECLALDGCGLEFARPTDGAIRFSIIVPDRV